MPKGLPKSLSRGNPAVAPVIRQDIVFSESVEVTGAAGSADAASVVIGDLPPGNILLLGAVCYLQLTGPTSDDLADDFQGDYSVSSAPDTDGTLGGDIVPPTAIPAATAEVTPVVRGAQADGAFCGVILDNTDGSLELNLNLLLDDGEITDTEAVALTAEGRLHLAYIVLGDD